MKKKIFIAIIFLSVNGIAKPCIEKKVKLATCYTQTVTQYENSKGEYVCSDVSPKIAVECASGQTVGSTKTTYRKAQLTASMSFYSE